MTEAGQHRCRNQAGVCPRQRAEPAGDRAPRRDQGDGGSAGRRGSGQRLRAPGRGWRREQVSADVATRPWGQTQGRERRDPSAPGRAGGDGDRAAGCRAEAGDGSASERRMRTRPGRGQSTGPWPQGQGRPGRSWGARLGLTASRPHDDGSRAAPRQERNRGEPRQRPRLKPPGQEKHRAQRTSIRRSLRGRRPMAPGYGHQERPMDGRRGRRAARMDTKAPGHADQEWAVDRGCGTRAAEVDTGRCAAAGQQR